MAFNGLCNCNCYIYFTQKSMLSSCGNWSLWMGSLSIMAFESLIITIRNHWAFEEEKKKCISMWTGLWVYDCTVQWYCWIQRTPTIDVRCKGALVQMLIQWLLAIHFTKLQWNPQGFIANLFASYQLLMETTNIRTIRSTKWKKKDCISRETNWYCTFELLSNCVLVFTRDNLF